jgi:hypothetical protein
VSASSVLEVLERQRANQTKVKKELEIVQHLTRKLAEAAGTVLQKLAQRVQSQRMLPAASEPVQERGPGITQQSESESILEAATPHFDGPSPSASHSHGQTNEPNHDEHSQTSKSHSKNQENAQQASWGSAVDQLFNMVAHTSKVSGAPYVWEMAKAWATVVMEEHEDATYSHKERSTRVPSSRQTGCVHFNPDTLEYFEASLKTRASSMSDDEWEFWLAKLNASHVRHVSVPKKGTLVRAKKGVWGGPKARQVAIDELEKKLFKDRSKRGYTGELRSRNEENFALCDADGNEHDWLKGNSSVGHGTFGHVFLCFFWHTMRYAAVKSVKKEGPHSRDHAHKIRHEIQIMKKFNHG